jgi:UDPglucose 6-dehydrogenase
MRVGFIALGKLGFPCAVGALQRGHEVWGYDIDERIRGLIRSGDIADFSYEPGIEEEFQKVKGRFHLAESTDEVVKACDLLLLSPQTPHPPELDGSVRFKHARKDFDYKYLISTCRQVAYSIRECPGSHKTVVVVSTVLPGTTRERLYPPMEEIIGRPLGDGWDLVYSPSFIAQSTVVRDYKAPEFALIGHDPPGNSWKGVAKYLRYLNTIHSAPKLQMNWESAELTKVCYNTFIGFKILLANTVMQLCDGLPRGDCDDVMMALTLATDRIVSPKYMHPGMGDGGGCHPRDNIAMAHICERLALDYNPFDFLMDVRERQTEFLADLALEQAQGRPIIVMGKAFKPNVDQTVGSPGILLGNILKEDYDQVYYYDDIVPSDPLPKGQAVYVMALNARSYLNFPFVGGSTIIDPWGFVPSGYAGCKVISVGRDR